ncbi:MAG: hypothetical protein ABH812_03370 [bacterium]
MKLRYLLLQLFLLVFILTGTVMGQDANQELKDIQDFKEKLASKVAELQKKDEKALSGFVSNIKDKTFNIQTTDNEQYVVELDELLTKYYSISGNFTTEITKEDVEENDYVIITGPINGKTITANDIYIDIRFASGSGIVSQIDQTNFSIDVVTVENETYTIDVESTTKREILNIKTYELDNIGFSKIKSGDVLHFVYKKTNEENAKNRYSASKILVLPQEYFSK